MRKVEQYLQDVVFLCFGSQNTPSIVLSIPPNIEHGDIAVNGFILAKSLGITPSSVAEKVCAEIGKQDFFRADFLAGHINLRFLPKGFELFLSGISVESRSQEKNSVIVVDYIGTNIGKPFHIGHLCTPNIGQSIINMGRWLGHTMIGDTHLGDWGSLFGKLAYGYIHFGKESEFELDPIQHMFQLYVRVSALEEADASVAQDCRLLASKLAQNDSETIAIWRKMVDASIHCLGQQMKLLDIVPTYNIGESFYEGLGLPVNEPNTPPLQKNMNQIVQELIEKGIATKNDDGSVGVVFDPATKIPSCILQKRDGTNLYATSDLACIYYRLTNGWNTKRMIYCVDTRQELHLRQCFAIARLAWPELLDGVELVHAANGAVVLPTGPMSTRKGNVVLLEKLIQDAFDCTKTIMQQKGRTLSDDDIRSIAIGALKFAPLSQDRLKDVVFTLEKALAFEGMSGPYIQYAAVRSGALLEKARYISSELSIVDIIGEERYAPDRLLTVQLGYFEAKVQKAFAEYKPHILAGYLYDVANEFNKFYAHVPSIIDCTDTTLRSQRLFLVQLTHKVLVQGLQLLSIRVPSEM